MAAAALPLIATAVGGVTGRDAAREQSRDERKAAERAEAFLREDLARREAAVAPARQIGLESLRALSSGNFDIESTPGFQFTMDQQRDALNRRLAAMGKTGSGEAIEGDVNLTGRTSALFAGQRAGELMSLAQLGLGQGVPQAGNVAGAIGSQGAAGRGFSNAQQQLAGGLPYAGEEMRQLMSLLNLSGGGSGGGQSVFDRGGQGGGSLFDASGRPIPVPDRKFMISGEGHPWAEKIYQGDPNRAGAYERHMANRNKGYGGY